MKTKFKSIIRAAYHSFSGTVCAGAVMLAFSAPAQNLFTSKNDNLIEIAPNGTQTIFISGFYTPLDLAFNSAGDLFEADMFGHSIYKFTPGGVQSRSQDRLAG